MKKEKSVQVLYIKPLANCDKTVSLDLQEALCHTFARDHGWHICNESYASLLFDDEITPNIYKQLIDICCTAAIPDCDVLLIASRQCLDIPEEYIAQVVRWLRENNVETWSVKEGKLS